MSAPPDGSPLLAVFGPTGVGKTALAAALAERLPCHLISCDAVQVYRDLEAASAKPRGAEARRPWALLDVVEPHRDINLGDWVRAAQQEIAWASRSGRLPVVVGGTGLYLRGLLKGVAEAPPRQPELRERLLRLAQRRGPAFLHRVLGRLDPPAAARLKPRDRQRLVRALEVRLFRGASRPAASRSTWTGPDCYPTLRVGLTMPREQLCARLDRRSQAFFARGLVAETRWLLEVRRVPRHANALAGIGYREVTKWLTDSAGVSEAELMAAVQRSTRRYAKRQLTWFRSEQPALWLDALAPDLTDCLVELVRRWLGGGRP